ncbi:hypothetical protein [Bradyrhizobium monzae]|uniref:hypothetical protein n=1 Tax=Bradyrhizobium sp. Oc8 TaxID=2876780 RepID=UPI001F404527|nr:hypothetical protein [Bradyrhizobium sp. Oc8]
MLNDDVVKVSLTMGRYAPLRMAAVMLAITWASETEAFPDQTRQLADAQQATTARNPGSDEFETLPPRPDGSFESIQVAQTTISDTRPPHQAPEQQRDWAESLSCELTVARRDIELLQHLEQEHDRAEWLVQDLNAARREVEAQKALASKAVEEASRLKEASRLNQAGESGSGELQASQQEELKRSALLAQDLAAARRDIETQTALAMKASGEVSRLKQAGETGEETSRLKQVEESGAAELRKAVQQERERSARLEQDLAAARQNIESQAALAATANAELSQRSRAAEANAADLRQSMQKERERADTLARDFSLTRSAIDAYQAQTALLAKGSEDAFPQKAAAESGAVELQKALQQERDRSRQLEQALAAARRDIDAQTTVATKASNEVAKLSQTAQAGAAEQRRSMEQEQERANALAHDLSMARSKIYAYEAQAAKVAEEAAQVKQAEASDIANLRLSQQKERERAEQLARDLAKASHDLDAQTERASKASEEVVRTKQAEERNSAELRSLLLRERARAERLERDLALARLDNGALVAKTPSAAPPLAAAGNAVREAPQPAPPPPIQNQAVQDQAIAARNQGDASVNPNDGVQSAKLIARASVLLKQGNIGAARIVLERAVEMGSAQASFALAETYDPLILPNFGTYGTQGDPTKARTLYARAEAGGIKEAKARFEALRR